MEDVIWLVQIRKKGLGTVRKILLIDLVLIDATSPGGKQMDVLMIFIQMMAEEVGGNLIMMVIGGSINSFSICLSRERRAFKPGGE